MNINRIFIKDNDFYELQLKYFNDITLPIKEEQLIPDDSRNDSREKFNKCYELEMLDYFCFKKPYFMSYKNFVNSNSTNYFKIFVKPNMNYEEIKTISISHCHLDITEHNNRKIKNKNHHARRRLINKIDKKLHSNHNANQEYCESISIEGVIFGSLRVYDNFIMFDIEESDKYKEYQNLKEFIFSSVVTNLANKLF